MHHLPVGANRVLAGDQWQEGGQNVSEMAPILTPEGRISWACIRGALAGRLIKFAREETKRRNAIAVMGMLNAIFKSSMGLRLSYSEIVDLLGLPISEPAKFYGIGWDPVPSQWRARNPAIKGDSIYEYWSNREILPTLKTIADQPTRKLQFGRLKEIMLNQASAEAFLKIFGSLPKKCAQPFYDYYFGSGYLSNSFGDKEAIPDEPLRVLTRCGLDIQMPMLTSIALLYLAKVGFFIDPNLLDTEVSLYGFAWEDKLRLESAIYALHVVSPKTISAEDCASMAIASRPVISRMESLLSDLKNEIAYGFSNYHDMVSFRKEINRLKVFYAREALGLEMAEEL